MRRTLALLFATLLLPSICFGQDLPAKYIVALSETGAGLSRGLTFHAPFTDPANPLTVYKGAGPLTFTRAHDATHTATFVSPDNGLITVASADQLRIEAQGALIEGERTNLCLRSATLGTTWSPTNITVSTDNAISPDGGLNAERLTATAANGTLIQDLGVIASAVKTFSIYLMRANGTGNVQLTLNGGTNWTTVAVTGSWARYSLTATLANPDVGIRIVTDNDAVWAWGAQAEEAAFASSYIPTVAAAITRNADGPPTVAISGNMDQTAGTIVLQFDTAPAFPTWSGLIGTDASYITSIHPGAVLYYSDGTNEDQPHAATITVSTAYRYAIGWSGTTVSTALNGVAGLANKLYDGSWGGTNLNIGTRIGATFHLFGHIKGLRIWNRDLSANEKKVVSQ